MTDPKAARKAILADAISGTDETDVPLAAPVTPVAPAAPAAAGPLMLSMADLQAIVKTAVEAATSGSRSNAETQTEVLQAMLETQMKLAQNPGGRHSNSDHENPLISAFNPLGDRDHKRPGLKCQMFIGQYDEEGKVEAAYPVMEDVCTYAEQVMCNALETGTAEVKRNDGKKGKVVIEARRDAAGKLNRVIIAFPYGWLSKEHQPQLPSFINALEQITGLKADEIQPTLVGHA